MYKFFVLFAIFVALVHSIPAPMMNLEPVVTGNCEQFTSCDECLNAPDCGWCVEEMSFNDPDFTRGSCYFSDQKMYAFNEEPRHGGQHHHYNNPHHGQNNMPNHEEGNVIGVDDDSSPYIKPAQCRGLWLPGQVFRKCPPSEYLEMTRGLMIASSFILMSIMAVSAFCCLSGCIGCLMCCSKRTQYVYTPLPATAEVVPTFDQQRYEYKMQQFA